MEETIKWPEGTRYFEVQKDYKVVIDELIKKGDIGALCDSETGVCFCIATNGCTPTLSEVKEFASDWFCEGEDAWWLCELTAGDAASGYDMGYTPKRKIFTEKDYHRATSRCYALFISSDWAHCVTVASGLTLEEAHARYHEISAPEGEKFIMVERSYHDGDKSENYTLLRVKDNAEKVYSGTLSNVINHLKDYPDDEDSFRMVVNRQ